MISRGDVCPPAIGYGTPIKYEILGDPRTKKNSQRIAGKGRRCPRCGKHQTQFIVQSVSYGEFAKRAAVYLRPRPRQPIAVPVNVKCLFFMETRRRVDQLNLLAAVDDLLVDNKILADDCASIVVGHDGSRVCYDHDRPRVEITITRVPVDEQLSIEGV